MKTLRIASLALAAFMAVAGAWYVNRCDYESAYTRGLLDGARIGLIKGKQKGYEEARQDELQLTAVSADAV